MKKLITIILSLIMTFFAVPNQSTERPLVTAEKPPQTAITIMVEQKYPKKAKSPQKQRL